MIYCVDAIKGGQSADSKTARNKAPEDIINIAVSRFHAAPVAFEVSSMQKNRFLSALEKHNKTKTSWKSLMANLQDGDLVILQHPYAGMSTAAKYIQQSKKKNNVVFTALIHDLYLLRDPIIAQKVITNQKSSELDILRACDYIICHNASMHAYLVETGIEEEKLVDLEIFDYLHSAPLPETRRLEKRVVLAGNLSPYKCAYLTKLLQQTEIGYQLELFGPGFQNENTPDFASYHGVCTPDELPGKLEGSFGLVWDGEELTTCSGNTGSYLRYNNPHKCSLFLASNMPVIIWKEAALAKFVEENGVGITVDSLLDIGSAIDALSEEDYRRMVENTKRVGAQLRSGHYFTTALSRVKEKLGEA